MREVSKSDINLKGIDITVSEITDRIYRISGFSNEFGITFNQFLINDEKPMLIHAGPIGMYKNIEEKIKEIIPLQKQHMCLFCILKVMNGMECDF